MIMFCDFSLDEVLRGFVGVKGWNTGRPEPDANSEGECCKGD